jgi:Tfp pilus assembly protein PilE
MLKTIRQHQRQPATQRGLSLFGLLVWAVIIAVVVIVGAKVVPSVTEYMACIKGAKVAATESTPEEARAAFERYASVGYITTISSKDLSIIPGRNGSLTVSFAYDKEIPLVGPVYLLIKYQGSSRSGADPY